ncbi:MAG: CPBP family intramembrane metalloprotease [Actinomycetota bacterium]|nr:CPBP family intramembrane metalloprotease [Actinomycetota bacterium]
MDVPRCAAHPEEPAAASCPECGGHYCSRCLRPMGGRLLCPSCAERAVYGGGTQVSGVEAHRAPERGPVAAKIVATCAFHPGVRAVTRCSRCGAFICSACQRVGGDRRYCDHCYQEMVNEPRRRAAAGGNGDALTSPSRAAWRLWPGLAFLPLPFLLSWLMTYMMRQGEEVSVGAAQLLVSLLLYSSTLIYTLLVVSRHGNARELLGMHGDNLAGALGLGVICGSLAFWIGTAGSFISVGLLERVSWVEEWLRSFFDVNVKNVTGADLLVAGLVIIIAAPVFEEIFFRGFLYPAMRRRMGVWSASLLNGFLFAAVHFSLFGLLGRTLVGTLFCLLYEYTGNLWSPVAAHGINNFVAFFLPLAAIWS